MMTRKDLIKSDEYWIETISNSLWRNAGLTSTQGDETAKLIFEDLKPILQEILKPSENDPVERLRNKLTPFITLVQMLDENLSSMPFSNMPLNELFVKELIVCKSNIEEVMTHLDEAHLKINK